MNCVKIFSLLLVVFTSVLIDKLVHSHSHSRHNRGSNTICKLFINDNNAYTDPKPLLLKPDLNEKHPYYYPENTNGEILINQGDEVLLACPGKSNYLTPHSLHKKKELLVKCLHDDIFTDGHRNYHFNDFLCKDFPASEAKYTGQACFNRSQSVVIGFQLHSTFLTQIELCFDNANMYTLYSGFNMTSAIGGYQHHTPRPAFVEAGFYNNSKEHVNKLYARKVQQTTLGAQLNSSELAEQYILANSSEFFYSRGHFTAKSDFVFSAQHRATFYYVNTAPQWQIFNGGNWEKLEAGVRSFAAENKYDLSVWTGSYGISTLPSVDDDPTLLYFLVDGIERRMQIPKYYWKVIYHPEMLLGTAFIGVNNPYQFNKSSDVFCDDICESIPWINWDFRNVTAGYLFCCEVNEFRQSVPHLPQFEVKDILI